MTAIKFCGLTRREDAERAVQLGAAALGFNFYEKSPRVLSIPAAKSLVEGLPAAVWRVGIFVNADPAFVAAAAREVGLTALQFHGDETPEYCAGFPSWTVIKAFRLGVSPLAAAVRPYGASAGYFLFDSLSAGRFGGTGKALEEEQLQELERTPELAARSWVAGGLAPETVGGIVRRIRPFGVDVASGIESAPGVKDAGKMTRFAAAVRTATDGNGDPAGE